MFNLRIQFTAWQSVAGSYLRSREFFSPAPGSQAAYRRVVQRLVQRLPRYARYTTREQIERALEGLTPGAQTEMLKKLRLLYAFANGLGAEFSTRYRSHDDHLRFTDLRRPPALRPAD